MADPININSLFADILPDPAAEMRQQQQDLLSVLGTVGGVAALNAPQQQQQLRAAAGGLFGIDTRTGSEKLREAMKGVDPNNPQDLIRLASMTDSIDPAKAVLIRQQAAQLTKQQRDEKEARERKSVEQQQADTTFDMNRAVALEALTSDVTAREEVGQQRAANATLVDNSTVLSEAEQTNYKALINSGAFDGKQADLLKVTNPSPLVFGNNAVIKDKDGNWTSITTPASTRNASGLESIARLTFDETDPKLPAVVKAIQAGEITTMTQLNSVLPEDEERAEIPKYVADVYTDTSEISRNAFVSNIRIDEMLETMETRNLLENPTAGAFADLRRTVKGVLGTRDEIEFLRTAYNRTRNTEIVGSLPKGTASDRDVALFSAGFPPENASMEEVYLYLQAAKRINNLNQEYNDLLGMYINTQADQGATPTTVGFDAEFKKYVSASNVLKSKVANARAIERPTQEQMNALEADLQVFEDTYGKLPIDLGL